MSAPHLVLQVCKISNLHHFWKYFRILIGHLVSEWVIEWGQCVYYILPVIENSSDFFYIFFLYLDRQILGFLIFSVGSRPIRSKLLEVPYTFSRSVSECVSEGNASIIYLNTNIYSQQNLENKIILLGFWVMSQWLQNDKELKCTENIFLCLKSIANRFHRSPREP